MTHINLKQTLNKLEHQLTRQTVTTKHNENITTYKNTNKTITINNTTYNDFNRICLRKNNNTITLYINHTTQRNYTKYPLTDINTIVIT